MQKPDQRAVPRVEVNSTASIQILGSSAGTNGEALEVNVVDASDRGMRLRSAVPMNAGQAVKIEFGDAMFLGEVCYCGPGSGDDKEFFYLGIVTKECLRGLTSLHHLMRALEPETARELERSR